MCETVVLKQGAKGSLIKHNVESKVGLLFANNRPGVRDLYAAGFLFGLIESLPVHKCGEIGALLSAREEVIGPKMDEEGGMQYAMNCWYWQSNSYLPALIFGAVGKAK